MLPSCIEAAEALTRYTYYTRERQSATLGKETLLKVCGLFIDYTPKTPSQPHHPDPNLDNIVTTVQYFQLTQRYSSTLILLHFSACPFPSFSFFLFSIQAFKVCFYSSSSSALHCLPLSFAICQCRLKFVDEIKITSSGQSTPLYSTELYYTSRIYFTLRTKHPPLPRNISDTAVAEYDPSLL